MTYKLKINNKFLKILTEKSILTLLEDNKITATEEKTLNNRYVTAVKFGTFNKRDVIKRVRILLEGYERKGTSKI